MRAAWLLLAVGCSSRGGAASDCNPNGTWQLTFQRQPADPGASDVFAPCADPPIDSATVVVTAAGNPGAGTWQGRAVEKLVVFDDAGTWDFTVFPSAPESGYSLIFTAKSGTVVDGELTRQPKKDGHLVCTDHFVVRGACK